jgi:hypothetical protein
VRYKDVNRLNRLQIWYRVTTSGCPKAGISSDVVPVTPTVRPYSWDFGSQVEAEAPFTEGWAVAAAQPNARGILVVTAAKGADPTATSPDGLNLPAGVYHRLVVAVVSGQPAALHLGWLVTGRSTWSAGIDCPIRALPDGTAVCDVDLASTPDWSGAIRRLQLSFPGTTGPVRVDRVDFDGSPPTTPLVGAIRWDGWFPDAIGGTLVDPSMLTDFDYRRPFYGWFDAPGPAAVATNAAHPTPLPQHQLDLLQELQQAKAGGLDFWAFNWYLGQPELPGSSAGPNPFTSALTDYETYLAAVPPGQQPLLDYTLIVDPTLVSQQDRKSGQLAEHPYWSNVLIPRLIQHFQESAYVKVDGNRPLVYWFGSAVLPTSRGFGDCARPAGPCWQGALDELVKRVRSTPGLGAPYFVDVRSDAQAATSLGLDGLSDYGPGVVGPVGCCDQSGHQPWSGGPGSETPAAIDDAVNAQTVVDQQGRMLDVLPALTATLDHRADNVGTEYAAKNGGLGSNFWFEYPTYSEWENHFRSTYDTLERYPGRSPDPGVMLIYAWNEISEGGGIVPTAQYGAYFLDAIRAVRQGTYPALYWNTWNDSNDTAIRYLGSWRSVGPAPNFKQARQRSPTTPVPGAYGNDEHLDANAPVNVGDRATIDLSGATAVRLMATTGPDRGIEHVALDGLGVDVDLYSPATVRQVIVFERDGLPKGRHQLTVSATGRRNPAATAATIGVDAVSALMARLGVATAGPLAPARLSATGYDGRVALAWDPVPGAKGYAVYRSGSPDGPWQQIHRQPSAGRQLSFDDRTVPAGMHAWYYQVRSYDSSRQGPPSDVAPAVTIADVGRGGVTSSGQGPQGTWYEVLFAGHGNATVDEVDLAGVAATPLTIEATPDGGTTWKIVYRSQAPGAPAADLGARQWVTFPPVTTSGLRVTAAAGTAPPRFESYFR